MQFCVDYRKTNELIKKDKFPLPKTDTCLDTLNGCNTLAFVTCTGATGRQKPMTGTVTKLPLSHGKGNGVSKC